MTVPPSPALLAHHGDRDALPGLVDLAVNVRDAPHPRWLHDAIAAADLARYPDATLARRAVAGHHGRDERQVLLTAGSAEAFVLLARTLHPEHAVVVHPQFTEPELALRAAGHAVDRVVLEPPYDLDPRAVPDSADLVVVGNPTNPTSVLHRAATLRALLRPGRTLVVDEAFMDAAGEAQSLAADDLPGLVVVRSLTKTWALAGLRAGYLLADAATITSLAAAQPPWAVSAPALAASIACTSDEAGAELGRWLPQLDADRNHLLTLLAGVPGVRVVAEPRAPFVLLEAEVPRLWEALRRKGFAVRRGDTFPGLGEHHLRVAVRDHATSDAFVSALRDAIQEARPMDVYETIAGRRDVRSGFTLEPVDDAALTRVLAAAHQAPSVGFSQPWDFLVVRDEATRARVRDLVHRDRDRYAASLPAARREAFAGLKVEAILETPINLVVTSDPTRGGRHVLGRHSQPQMAAFSTACAVQNLWLAARAEGLGVGWVSFFDERELAAELGLPPHVEIVAYLCLGHVESFADEPELASAGWARRRPLGWTVHQERWGDRALPGDGVTRVLEDTIAAIEPLDTDAVAAAIERQGRLTKPPGSLGVLEDVSVQLAGLTGQCPPPVPSPAAVAVFAADHGVHAQGVSPWPQEVTTQMVGNFLAGGAVINALAAQVGAEVVVVDVGVAATLDPVPGLLPRKVRAGTRDLAVEAAMTRDEARAAVEVGIEVARDLVAAGNRCLLTGDMGIANTTASAALISVFTGRCAADVTGRGTGIDDATLAHKVSVIERALALHRPDASDPLGVLAAVGGLEHAALAGFLLGAAALRVPVVLDGVIACSAALVARALAPDAVVAMIAGHRSAEPGATLALDALGLVPLVSLDLRLGEGSGAALALPLLQGAARVLREVATFDSAGVTEK